jgi:NAD(P)-dependent dehydrogenase (short-subunit alcohol dehydrogenase family)
MVDLATTPAAKPSIVRRLALFLVFLIASAALGACAYLYNRLRQEEAARAALATEVAAIGPRFEQFKEAVRGVDRQLRATVFQEVDLGSAGWQPIAGGFYIIDLAVGPAEKGTRIAGKIINPTSVVHESAQLSIRVGEQRATFALPKVPPAVAQPFEVTLPEVPPGSAKKAFIALEGSTISFSSSTTRKRPGIEPVDTDKLLK